MRSSLSTSISMAVLTLSSSLLMSGCANQPPPTQQDADAEVRREYDRVVALLPREKEYEVRHILVETRDIGLSAIIRIKAGEPFAAVAKDLSLDPSSRLDGGNLGWNVRENFTDEFSQTMVALAPTGLTTTPTRSQFGWHVIEVTATRMRPPPDFEKVKDQIRERLRITQIR